LRFLGCVTGLCAAFFTSAVPSARAQKVPTAVEQLHISAFGGITGRETQYRGGRNGDITAGFDFGFRPYRFIRPSVEVRGTIDVDKGHVDGQKDILGGIKLETRYRALHPYVDFLVGRAGVTYPGTGAQVPGENIFYTSSSATALDGGGGFDFDLTRHFAFKADSQLLRFDTPVTPAHIHPYEVTLGVTYRIGGGWRHPKKKDR
jgi:hypothetical protein